MKMLDKLRNIDAHLAGKSHEDYIENNTMEKIIERAHHKSLAKICMLEIKLGDLRHDLLHGNYGPLNRSEVKLLAEGTRQELNTWNYIYQLIIKENNI